jgi:hypothetical protein
VNVKTVGASLLAKAVGQAILMLDVLTPSRAGSLPQGFGIAPGFWVRQIANVGVSLLAMAVGQVTGMSTVRTLSRAGSLLQGVCGWLGICGVTNSQCGSEPACEGGGSGNIDVGCADAFASRLAPTGICGWLGICGVTDSQCRSEPARDGGGSGNGDVDCTDAIASRLTPTGDLWLVRDLWRDR